MCANKNASALIGAKVPNFYNKITLIIYDTRYLSLEKFRNPEIPKSFCLSCEIKKFSWNFIVRFKKFLKRLSLFDHFVIALH